MQKMLWGVCFLLIATTLPLWAHSQRCSTRLTEFKEEIASRFFDLKKDLDKVLLTKVPLVFDEEQYENEIFEKGEADFLEELGKAENSYDNETQSELWVGKQLKAIPHETLKDFFRYLNWYRFQQRQIQKLLSKQLVNFEYIPSLIEKFFSLEKQTQRIKLVIFSSHFLIPIEVSSFGAQIYNLDAQELLALNIESIPRLVDHFNVHFQNQFSTLIATECKNNAGSLFEFTNRKKRKPQGKKIFSIHNHNPKKRSEYLEVPCGHSAHKFETLELRDFYSIVEEILPQIIKKPTLRTRFAMVYGLYGYEPRPMEHVAKMEGVTRPAIYQLCIKFALPRIREYLQGKGITAQLFEE